jgi:hypothetical protein
VIRFESPWLSWSPKSANAAGKPTDETDRRALVSSVSRGADVLSPDSDAKPRYENGPVSPLTKLTEGCAYFIGAAPTGRCARCRESYGLHVDRALGQPIRRRYVPASGDEDEP